MTDRDFAVLTGNMERISDTLNSVVSVIEKLTIRLVTLEREVYMSGDKQG